MSQIPANPAFINLTQLNELQKHCTSTIISYSLKTCKERKHEYLRMDMPVMCLYFSLVCIQSHFNFRQH